MLSASVVGVGAVKSQAFGIPAGAQQRMACENISICVCKCVSVFVSVCVAVSGAVVYCRQSICSSPPHTHTHSCVRMYSLYMHKIEAMRASQPFCSHCGPPFSHPVDETQTQSVPLTL